MSIRITRRRFVELYEENFVDARRERMFLSAAGFLTAFGTARAVTGASHRQQSKGVTLASHLGPSRLTQWMSSGRGIHHYVYGIALLLASGYSWLFLGREDVPAHRQLTRATSCLYGVGSAMTLDEANLLLNLKGNYWQNPQRRWIDGAVIATAVLSLGGWGYPFVRALAHEVTSSAAPSAAEESHDGGA